MTMQSYLKQTQQAAEAARERAKVTDATKLEIAQWFDARATPECPMPKYLHLHELYGSVGSMKVDPGTPADVIALLAAFPPVELGAYRGAFASIMPKQFFESSEKHQQEYPDRRDAGKVLMKLQRTAPAYGTQLTVSWWTQYGDKTIVIDVQLTDLLDSRSHSRYLPGLAAEVKYASGVVTSIGNTKVAWPEGSSMSLVDHVMSHGGGDRRSYSTITLGGRVEDYLHHVVGRMSADWMAKLDAYKADVVAGVDPVASEGAYANQHLKAGTKAQHDCLNTLEARTDAALAKKHWEAYSYIYDLEESGYFSHYVWACHWLERHNLLTVKLEQDGVEVDHKYGSAWL